MLEVSDRIADNRGGQFGFNTQLAGSRSSPNIFRIGFCVVVLGTSEGEL